MDAFARTIDYLRISVTDRCNERCLYCMPEGYRGWAQRSDHLAADEILRVVETAAGMGFRKFRLTGGEPLVRSDLVNIAERIWEVPGVEALGVSTNGLRLKDLARPLRQAGVRAVNISLDTLDPRRYGELTGGSLGRVIEGIEAACDAGFERVKLNCVLLRGINEDQILPLARFGAALGCPVRFIELMPVGPGGPIQDGHFFSIGEAVARLEEAEELLPVADLRLGHGPARYFRMSGIGALVGFIGAITCPDFCATCNKMRLTADGRIRPCLGREGEIDLKGALRDGISNLEELMAAAVAAKPERHGFDQAAGGGRPMTAVGG
jgi:cyclic pyranopterin phosphate synthase